jgi:DNA polymerase I-like protein with 3'-5' exonuclease and polymerase domains
MSTDWQPPTDLPDLRRAGIIALDTETNDEGLRADRGSAWPWRDGYVCGVSVAYRADSGIRSQYFPVRHPGTANFDPAQVFQWLKDLVASDVRFITQNGLYDWGWLGADGSVPMPPSERLEEIGALATLIDEDRYNYSLDSLCAWRGLPGKNVALLEQAVRAAGLAPKRKKKINVQEHIWQLPANVVGPYGEADPACTFALWESLDPLLDKEGTRNAYRLEVDLLPMVLEMRRRGIRIDTAAAERARDLLLQRRDVVFAEISEKLGSAVSMAEIGRTKWLAENFDQHGISYPRTEKGNPSFTAGNSGWMPHHPHWLPRLITKADKYNNAAANVLETFILGHVVNGRVHAEIHPHRSDEGGTRSLRFSYSDPPLQLMPARDKELASLIRGVFLPEEGEVWVKPDISQQEFRFVVHYAVRHKLSGAKEVAELYRSDPKTDVHKLVAKMGSLELERDVAKAINYAKIFGAGVKRFAEMISMSEREAAAIYKQYDRKFPFVSQLSQLCERAAQNRGYLTLYDDARRHWNQWAPRGKWKKGLGPCSRDTAIDRVRNPEHPWYRKSLWRADTRTAMNALIQGSAARHTKLWMRACWREGILPLLQMHDALECSVTAREQGELVARLGCEAVQLEVPMQVDLKFGRSWGDATHTWDELHGTAPMQAPPTVTPIEHLTVINGTKFHTEPVAAKPAIELAQKYTVPSLADLIDEPIPRSRKIRCRFHDDHTPSLHIYDDHFHCFVCDAHGDRIDWLMIVEELDRDEAIHVLETWNRPLVKRAPAQDDDENKRLTSALQLWEAAKPIAGTLAERYLADTRRIDLTALPATVDEVLRFHPCCPFGPGIRHPCLLALMRDTTTDKAIGIQRIALTPDAKKIDRRMFGRAGVVKLWPAENQLIIGEGLETTLAAATRIPYHNAPLRPAWATLSASALQYFPLVPGVKQLIILADHDLNGKGQAAAEACKQRWEQAGRAGVVLLPERPGADFNDVAITMLEHVS